MKNTIASLRLFGAGLVLCAFVLAGCSKQDLANTNTAAPNDGGGITPINSPIPTSPGTIIVPADNPINDAKFAARVELGRHFFYDKAFSVDQSTSCATCHSPALNFTDPRGMQTSMGFFSRPGTRNTPGLANVAYYSAITWDGKFKTLEEHALAPIFNNIEMGNNFSATGADPISSGYYHSDPGANDTLFLFGRIEGLNQARTHTALPSSSKRDANGKTYYDLMNEAWGTSTYSLDLIQKSIACFERTFVSTGSTFDRFNSGDETAYKYNPQALHGFTLFTDTKGANCVSCHSGYNFSDQKFHDNGLSAKVSMVTQKMDSGRVGISKDPNDVFKFRTPGLRNVALTGPFMHDGRFQNLDEVLAFYNRGGDPGVANKDEKIKPLNLSDQDMADIIEFLKTLTDSRFTANPAYANPWGK
jgi:cytochrome c peroxidase